MGIITLKDCPVAKRPGFTKNKWEDAVLRIFARVVFPAFVLLSVLDAARAEAIAIGNYGASANGMPFGVALAKGYFQEEGANVTSIIASEGGGTSVRNAMSGVAYGEANPGAIAVAIQQGADLRIVSDNVLTIAEFAWLEKGFADQDNRRPQGQEDRLHQSAFDQPGARHSYASEGWSEARGRRTREDRRFRPDGCGARARADRRC